MLTTKEYGGRFVDHQVQPLNLLTTQQVTAPAPGARDDDDAHREYHSDLPLVNTPTIRQVITTSQLLVQLHTGLGSQPPLGVKGPQREHGGDLLTV